MNITPQSVTLFGYGSITIMLIMLGLVVFRIVPDSLAIPFFIIALVLFVARLVLRVRLAKQERDKMNLPT